MKDQRSPSQTSQPASTYSSPCPVEACAPACDVACLQVCFTLARKARRIENPQYVRNVFDTQNKSITSLWSMHRVRERVAEKEQILPLQSYQLQQAQHVASVSVQHQPVPAPLPVTTQVNIDTCLTLKQLYLVMGERLLYTKYRKNMDNWSRTHSLVHTDRTRDTASWFHWLSFYSRE